MFQSNQLKLELIGLEKADVVQEIYNQSPTYFRRVDGTDPLPTMAEKDILDTPPKKADSYVKAPVLIYEDNIPVGYADLHVNYRSQGIAYLGLLILREGLQGKGLGRRAFFAVQDFLKVKFNIEKIYLGVSNHNQVQGYWEKMGFKPNGFTYTWQGEKIKSEVTEMEKIVGNQILRLEKPSESLYQEFSLFVEDMRANNQTLWDPYLPKANEKPLDFVNRLLKRESEPEAPLVPETIYWATFDGHVVGRISLRHRLEGNLHKIGGHIGYEVSPKWRRRGFATEMLRQILLTDKSKKIGKLLLTCSPQNEASNKTIVSNGGKLTQTVFVDMVQEERNHYWIDLSENKRINVERYNPEWKNWFESLRSTAWAVVKPWALSIEHVGSTAIEGLSAKPIIDIDIVVENIKALGPTISALESIGYLHKGNLGIEGREAFRAPTSAYKHNLYVCVKGCASLRNHLLLREQLNTNKDLRDKYGSLKTMLAESVLSIDEYIEGKTAFILGVLSKAGMSSQEIANIKSANKASFKKLVVNSNDQTAELRDGNKILKKFSISTATNGLSCQENSFCTPIGKLRVASKIGEGLPLGSVIRSRVPSGELWSSDPNNPLSKSNEDLVLTRLLWLEGAEEKNSNTFKRYVYLHGTNQEHLLGKPASHGCIRFSNKDIVEIFDALQAGNEVEVV